MCDPLVHNDNPVQIHHDHFFLLLGQRLRIRNGYLVYTTGLYYTLTRQVKLFKHPPPHLESYPAAATHNFMLVEITHIWLI